MAKEAKGYLSDSGRMYRTLKEAVVDDLVSAMADVADEMGIVNGLDDSTADLLAIHASRFIFILMQMEE